MAISRALALATFLSLPGCSLVSIDRYDYYRDGEGVFQSELLEAIEPGVTDSEWLAIHFGAPVSFYQGPQNSLLSTWQFSRLRQKSATFFGVMRYRNTNEQRRYLHVVLREDRVIKYWHDHMAQVNGKEVFRALGLREEQAEEPASALETGAP